jgi:hypothetical protein
MKLPYKTPNERLLDEVNDPRLRQSLEGCLLACLLDHEANPQKYQDFQPAQLELVGQ